MYRQNMLVPFINKGIVGIGKDTGGWTGGMDRISEDMRHQNGFVNFLGTKTG